MSDWIFLKELECQQLKQRISLLNDQRLTALTERDKAIQQMDSCIDAEMKLRETLKLVEDALERLTDQTMSMGYFSVEQLADHQKNIASEALATIKERMKS